MSLIVTGTIGIDAIHTPHGSAEAVLGGSCTYFAAAASFFTPVRMVAAVGGDFHEGHRRVFTHFPNVSVEGIELREESKTFAWAGALDDMNARRCSPNWSGRRGRSVPRRRTRLEVVFREHARRCRPIC